MRPNVRAGSGTICFGVGVIAFSVLLHPVPFADQSVKNLHDSQYPVIFPYLIGAFFILFGLSMLLDIFPDEYIESRN